MQETNNNIGFIENITSKVLRLAGNANSNEVIIGFVLSGVEKLNKINSVLKRLYPLVNEYNDVEFSVGILLRSLMMDSIQTQYLASLIEKNLNESKAKIIDELSHCCLKFMTDSTGFILNEILDNDSLSTKQKENNKENILRQFRNLQLNSIGKYKSEKIILKDIYEKSKSDLAKERNAIYDIYTMYSKYDHLSYWTAFVSNKMSFDKRLNFLDKAIFLLILNLRTLLFIACNYGDKIVLDECLLEVENYLNKK